jgi:AraC family transcriptional regulator of arabinose operon
MIYLNAPCSLDNTKVKIRNVFEWFRKPDLKPVYFQNPYTVIWFVMDGVRSLNIHNQRHDIKRGDIIVIPSSTSFCIYSEDHNQEILHYLSIGCDWRVGSFDFVELYQFPNVYPVSHPSDLDRLKSVWLNLLHVWNEYVIEAAPGFVELFRTTRQRSFFAPKIDIHTPQTGAYLSQIGCFYQWAAVLLKITQPWLPETPRLPDARIEKVCEFVDHHYAKPLTVNDLCKNVFLSDSHLRQLFKRNLNTTPMNYIRKVRLEKAKELLVETIETVSQIAHQVGFEDVSYFNRLFRKRELMTPTEYRRKMSSF